MLNRPWKFIDAHILNSVCLNKFKIYSITYIYYQICKKKKKKKKGIVWLYLIVEQFLNQVFSVFENNKLLLFFF